MSEKPLVGRDWAPAGGRYVGVPLLFAVAYSAVGFSLYFALGAVAERGLGLTPLIFFGVGVVFLLNMLTYVEGEAMLRERGGSATFARAAFKNELISFTAGWAIIIDYIIVIALAALSVPHYLTPIWDGFTEPGAEVITAGLVIVLVTGLGIAGYTGIQRQRMLAGVAAAGVVLLAAVVVVGALSSWDPGAITAELDPFATPTFSDVIYASVIATVAFAGIEAASNLAPDLRAGGTELRRLVLFAATLVPLVYVGVSAVGLMVLPVAETPAGPQTPLGTEYLGDPVLGIVQNLGDAVLTDLMEVAVVAIVPAALVWAASTAMLGLSRHAYVLAKNRQIPVWLGRLNRRFRTPHVAIVVAAVIAFALVVPTDVKFLAGLFAFGGTIAFTIAHASIIKLRLSEPERPRPYAIPFSLPFAGGRVPLPTLIAAVLTALAWVSVIVYHEDARWAGGGWMLFGLLAYVIYRGGIEKTSITQHVEVPEESLVQDYPVVAYERILVPVFGTKLDDDIVGTAGRLADAAKAPGDENPSLILVYVVDLPLTVPVNAAPSQERKEIANAALDRAADVAAEYETVDVIPLVARARTVGSGIVETARREGAEVIVMGGEPPSPIKGGAVLGGIGGERPQAIGPVTQYVLKRAPCRVLLTAPGLEAGGDRDAGRGPRDLADAGAPKPADAAAEEPAGARE